MLLPPGMARSRSRPAVAGCCLLVLFAACTTGEGTPEAVAAEAAAEQPPERFGFGIAADSGRIVAWDVDVRPDGAGLPPGSGTVAGGERVYQQRCAACHGPTGQEGSGGRLVSTEPWGDFPAARAVGNYWPYATTLYDYIVRAMPLDAPGSLTADETYAVIAYVLHLNEILPADAVMDATTLPAVRMPARDRFVPDDRTDGPVIR
jgi:cytochrome c